MRVFQTPKLPEIQFSLNTNYCDLGFCLAPDGQRLVIVSCEDNLIKGAAGQAVQNMNLMYRLVREEGFIRAGCYENRNQDRRRGARR